MDTRETHGEDNYQPNRSPNTMVENPAFDYSQAALGATTVHHPIRIRDEYRQAGDLYRSVSKQDQDDLIRIS
ncbi:hypothetical protein RBB77_17765 [Tunturibacter psychrotolerans]|uniref:Catalase n=1 Tax=Tunturiibacter psychrotolerans TaxID=3069686 RepID=A0AAU7ZN59_9BACT